jgi:hypothetical protein
MRNRILGRAIVAVLLLLGAPVSGETCREVLTTLEGGPSAEVLWVGEALFSDPLDSACRDQAKLAAFIRESLRPQRKCSTFPPVEFWADSSSRVPERRPLSLEAVVRAPVVVVGEVEEIRPGITPNDGTVWSLVQVRVTEWLRVEPPLDRSVPWVSFLAPGGELQIDGAPRCMETPSWARVWRQGDRVLVAGSAPGTTTANFVATFASAYEVLEERISPPASSPFQAGSLSLEDIRTELQSGAE